jgi:hypothetical protein
MFIVNKHGVIHEVPNDKPAPAGSRPATEHEINEWRRQDEKRKSVIAAEKQAAKVASARVVITGESPDAHLTEEDRRDLAVYRADPANPNTPYEDPKPLHSGRPPVYPPTGEPYNPLTGLPERYDGAKRAQPSPAERTEGIPYDPATGDYLRVTPASPLDPAIEPPQGQPGGRPIHADVNAEVTPGERIPVVSVGDQPDGAQARVNWNSRPAATDPDGKPARPNAAITTVEGSDLITDADRAAAAQDAQSRSEPQGRAGQPSSKIPSKPEPAPGAKGKK